MADDGLTGEAAARRYAVLRPYLDERQRRLVLGAEAAELGRGGIKAVAVATGVHPDTVAKGARELEGDLELSGRCVPGSIRPLAQPNKRRSMRSCAARLIRQRRRTPVRHARADAVHQGRRRDRVDDISRWSTGTAPSRPGVGSARTRPGSPPCCSCWPGWRGRATSIPVAIETSRGLLVAALRAPARGCWDRPSHTDLQHPPAMSGQARRQDVLVYRTSCCAAWLTGSVSSSKPQSVFA